MQDCAKQHGMVIVVPIHQEKMTGVYFNTAAAIAADGSYLGKSRKNHIPHVVGFREKFFFKPGNSDWPVFATAYCKRGVYICYDRRFPEDWRALALGGAEYIANPSPAVAGLSQDLWELEQPAAAANDVLIGAIDQAGTEAPWNIGEIVAQASDDSDELLIHEIDLDMVRKIRNNRQFFRDRRPELYDPLIEL